jgi:hypothetical protein
VAPVVINLATGIRIDFCDISLDSPLLGQELLIMAVLLLGLISCVSVYIRGLAVNHCSEVSRAAIHDFDVW